MIAFTGSSSTVSDDASDVNAGYDVLIFKGKAT